MELIKKELLTASGLHISMPVPGVVRVTDGSHPRSWMVSAPLRPAAPRVENGQARWGRVAVEPDNGMALYYDGVLLCAD